VQITASPALICTQFDLLGQDGEVCGAAIEEDLGVAGADDAPLAFG
jgi:hypothetical protein